MEKKTWNGQPVDDVVTVGSLKYAVTTTEIRGGRRVPAYMPASVEPHTTSVRAIEEHLGLRTVKPSEIEDLDWSRVVAVIEAGVRWPCIVVDADLRLAPIDVGFDLRTQDMAVTVPANCRSASYEQGGEIRWVYGDRQAVVEALSGAGYRIA